MREELGTGTGEPMEAASNGNKWSEEVAVEEEQVVGITAEEKLAAELADELSKAPEDAVRPEDHLQQQQHRLLVSRKRKNSTQSNQQQQQQQLSTGITTNKRQRRPADRNNRLQVESSIKSQKALAAGGDQKQVSDNTCAACLKPIHERYLLMALDKPWHEDCLKCACCDCRLAEVGSSLFVHSDKILCRRDFARIFGPAGTCAACKQVIPPHEMVMRAHRHAYHMDCFRCLKCLRAFCVGDPYYLNESQRILCVECHELSGGATRNGSPVVADASHPVDAAPATEAGQRLSQTQQRQLEEQPVEEPQIEPAKCVST